MPFAIIIGLVVIIIVLIVYNMSIHKKVDAFKKINDILIEKYNIKYSTIVVYNGAEYIIKASNVAEKHWDVLKSLQSEPVFKDSIETGIPKYITVDKEGEKLPYQKMEFGRAKAAMFFPLYIDNVYIGYWIIEGSIKNSTKSINNRKNCKRRRIFRIKNCRIFICRWKKGYR